MVTNPVDKPAENMKKKVAKLHGEGENDGTEDHADCQQVAEKKRKLVLDCIAMERRRAGENRANARTTDGP